MKIIYGIVFCLLVLKVADSLFSFFSVLFTEGATFEKMIIFNLIISVAVLTYVSILMYKEYVRKKAVSQ